MIYSAVVSLQFKKLLRLPIARQVWQRLHSATTQAALGTPSTKVAAHSQTTLSTGSLSPLHPDQLQVTEAENCFSLRHRTYRSGDWIWMGFNGLYDGFALLIGAIALWCGTWMSMGGAVGFILLLGLLWTWHTLARLCNYTTITLNDRGLTRQDAPLLSWMMPIHIPLHQLVAVKAATIQRSGRSPLQAIPEYRVHALLVGGRQVSLLRHLEHWEDAQFIEDQVSRFCLKLKT